MNITRGRHVVVVGTQWGDEGKGKLVDWLTETATGVIRFQGGHNAGHTLVINGIKTALHLIPSGIMRPGVRRAAGDGVRILPPAAQRDQLRIERGGATLGRDRGVQPAADDLLGRGDQAEPAADPVVERDVDGGLLLALAELYLSHHLVAHEPEHVPR